MFFLGSRVEKVDGEAAVLSHFSAAFSSVLHTICAKKQGRLKA
jgi:hypothetical protein